MFLLVPAHPGRPGQRAVKRLCVCVCMHASFIFIDGCKHLNACMFQVRRRVRPMFLSSHLLKFIYDSITFVATRIAIAYLGFPFLVLELQPVLEIYRLYFLHYYYLSLTLSHCCL